MSKLQPVMPCAAMSCLGILVQAANGVVISAGDSLSSLKISGCTFRGSYSAATGSPTGIGGAVYSTGSLQIENTTFEDNHFVLLNSVTNSSSTTPSPTGSTNTTEVTSWNK